MSVEIRRYALALVWGSVATAAAAGLWPGRDWLAVPLWCCSACFFLGWGPLARVGGLVLLAAAAIAAFRTSTGAAILLAVSGVTLGATALSLPSVPLRRPSRARVAAAIRRGVVGPTPALVAQVAVMALVVSRPSVVDPFPASVGLVAAGVVLPPLLVATAASALLSVALVNAWLENRLAPQLATAAFLQLFGVAIRRLVVGMQARRGQRAIG